LSYQPPYRISEQILQLVSDLSAAIARYELLEPQLMTPMLRKEFKIRTIVGTLEIEGNTMGTERITAILDGKRVLGSPREIAEVKGAILAYERLHELNMLSMQDLLNAHEMLMGDILKDAGKLRRSAVGVGGPEGLVHIAPPAKQVSALMDDLFHWLAETDVHPLVRSCIFHYELEFIHPFTDGNGRIGRLWQTLILHEYKAVFASLPIEAIIRDHQQQYYDALEAAGSRGESTTFIEFMLGIIRLTIEGVVSTGQVIGQVTDQVKSLLSVMGGQWWSTQELLGKLGLSHRQTFRENYLNPALEANLIEMQHPDSRRSPKQKYRIKKAVQ